MAKLTKKRILEYENNGYDLEFIQEIQPFGNINFKRSNSYSTGDGFQTIFHVYGYPSEGLENAWLQNLVQQDYVRSFLSVDPADNSELIKALETSIGEKETRISSKAKSTDNMTESDELMKMSRLFKDLTNKNISMKYFYVRLFVFAPSLEELEERKKTILDKTKQFKMVILQDELDIEYKAAWTPPAKQKLLDNGMKGTPITAKDLAGGYFFEHTKLEDSKGSYMGYTRTQGAINFDFFERTTQRTRSLMFVSGNKGMGKDTFISNLTEDLFARGHYIRTINADTTGLTLKKTREQFGLILDVSGTENRINPFQIFPTVTKSDGVTVDEIKSFGMHIEKLKNMLVMLNSDVTADDLQVFELVITNFYIEVWGIWYVNPHAREKDLVATRYKAEHYPILQDVITYLDQIKRNNSDPTTQQSINRIFLTFSNLLSTKGEIFNGTTQFKNVSNEKVVTYDVSGLLGQTTIFNAQVFSVLSLLSADIINNAKKNRDILKNNSHLTESDLNHYVVNFNRAETILNPSFPLGVQLITSIVESMADNFAGVIMSVNSLQGLLFDNRNISTQDTYATNVVKLFGLMQYRVFAQTSETDIPLLANALTGSLSESEISVIPKLRQKQLFFNIAGMKNLTFTQEIQKDDLQSFGGWR